MHCLRDLSQDALKAKSLPVPRTHSHSLWLVRKSLVPEHGAGLSARAEEQKYFRSGGKIDNPSISFRESGQVRFAA